MTTGSTVNPRPGQHLHFVRFVRTRDGWMPQTLRGELEERTDAGWRVRIIDDAQELPESEWSIHRP